MKSLRVNSRTLNGAMDVSTIENLRDAEGRTERKFLEDQFECEYCSECHGDVEDHDAIPLNFGAYSGNNFLWFARCKRSYNPIKKRAKSS